MKIADLYCRVSSDEQAKGYSLRSQEELLRKYCAIHKIEVRKVIFEDHSAKTFNRPEWKAYLAELKKNKGKTDLLLFLKWDRFSRNTGDAYQMINTLNKLGVDPQAVEQPLDLSVPENKLMLAFYLAAPQVENERRALNVIDGMRQAMKDGRYMGLAPVGYVNKTDDSGKKSIEPVEPYAGIIRWAYEEIAKGVFNTEQVYKLARKKGFNKTKSLFWFAIRNPVYCGKIFVPKHKGDASHFVKAQHEPLISEDLYYRVQDVLDGRKRNQYKAKIVSAPLLPLRGFLECPECGKLLTGSSSKGHTKYYAYYHCFGGCNFRYRADNANEQFVSELRRYIPREELADVFRIIVEQVWKNQTGDLQQDHKQLLKDIGAMEEKLAYLRELLISKQIEPEDYREMKSGNSEKLERLKAKLAGLNQDIPDVKALLKQGIDNLIKLDCLYEAAEPEGKRSIISSMFPEKMGFENNALRTGRVNEVVRIIYLINNELGKNKKGQNGNSSILSSQVGVAGRCLLSANILISNI
jgi:site-specific DNA recombinase